MKKINGVIISDVQGGYSFVGLEPNPSTYVDQTTAGVLMSNMNVSLLMNEGFPTSREVKIKLFYNDVTMDNTSGGYTVSVHGNIQTNKSRPYNLSWDHLVAFRIRQSAWDQIELMDATVSVAPIAPTTQVSFNCVLGVATYYDGGSY